MNFRTVTITIVDLKLSRVLFLLLHGTGSDSPTTHAKDVTTHTRAMKLKHQALQDRLEICILELKKLCIREAVSHNLRRTL